MFKTGLYGSEEDFYYLGLVTCAEMLKTGTTTFATTHAYHKSWGNFDSLAKAVEDTGIRGMLAFGISDKARVAALRRPLKETFRACERAYTKLNGRADGRIGVWIAPSGFGMSSNEAIVGSVEFAKRHRTRIHMHVSGNWAAVNESLWELGKTEVAYMRDVGLLGSNTLAAHCTWVNDADIDILKETNTQVVHNPVSNMYLAAGVAPVPKMQRAGINVALGTDGLGSNTKDMFETMRIAGYLHKVYNMDTGCINATKLLEMATINGAKALGLQQSIGSLEEGKSADLISVSLNRLHLTPFKNVIPALVYCAKGSDVDTVIVNGNIVVDNGLLLVLNEEDLIEKARKKFEDLWARGAYS
jgi:5-methylthioadenosine/S-adenosylhomocysteine deaminase